MPKIKRIIIDAMGGDNAPLEILKGTFLAVKEYGIKPVLVGNEEVIKKCAKDNNIALNNTKIVNSNSVISMHDDAKCVLKEKSDSSMAVGFKLLNDGEGDAFVSAGNTGCVTVGATLITKRIKGVKRPAIASVMPSAKKPFLLMDCGANAECRSEFLYQFGQMGSLYNFIGNIEGRQIPFGDADVVVADGFTGNLILKTYEGVAKVLMNGIKDAFMKNTLSKLAYLGVKSGIDDMKKQFDYKEYGGAVMLGVKKPVVKAHGSADARTFKNAIKQAVWFIDNDLIETMETWFSKNLQEA